MTSLIEADLRTPRRRILDALAAGEDTPETDAALAELMAELELTSAEAGGDGDDEIDALMIELGLHGRDPGDVVALVDEAVSTVVEALDAIKGLELASLAADDDWIRELVKSLRRQLDDADREAAAILKDWLEDLL